MATERGARWAVRFTAWLTATAATLGAASPARAAGLYYSDRGVRPLGRGGAFVAGADDLNAIWYNPAGLVEAGSQVLLDASVMSFSASYTRVEPLTISDPNTGRPLATSLRRDPTVKSSSPFLPLPTIAGSYAINRDLVVAAGVYAPYAALTNYPESVNGQPAPQRYSLYSLDGTSLVTIGAYLAWRPKPWLEVGAGPTLLVGQFKTSLAFSGCVPDHFICAPEQPEYDGAAKLSTMTFVAPSGTLGVTVIPDKLVRIGSSFQLPYWISTGSTAQFRLPSATVFQNATVDGNQEHVTLRLPWVWRVGVETRPARLTRIEATFVFEKWSMQDQINVTSNDITINNLAGFPPSYSVSKSPIQRGFQDAWSVRLGGEQGFDLGATRLDVRAGVAYEKSGVPPAFLSVSALDFDKVTLGLGAGVHVTKRLRLDASGALILTPPVDVSVDQARLYPVQVVRANQPPTGQLPINAGHYEASARVFGLGLRYQLD